MRQRSGRNGNLPQPIPVEEARSKETEIFLQAENLLNGKIDPNREQEENSPRQTESQEPDASSPVYELNKALNLTRAFNKIKRVENSSDQETQEILESVLQKDLSKRLNSLVLISNRDRESVITRGLSRSIATSTPIVSANPSPEHLLRCQHSNPLSSNCSELSSIDNDVFLDTEPVNPRESHPNQQPVTLFNKKDQKSTQTVQATTKMEDAEKEIEQKSSALTYRLTSYDPNSINEFDIGDKLHLRKLEEVEKIQEEVIDRVDRYLREFPATQKRPIYEDIRLKALANVNVFE